MIPNPLSRARTSARRRLMIVSAKGGVGKSTVTVNLAAALTARGHRTGIFDADLHGPNVAALLGVHRRKKLKEDGLPDPDEMFTIEARAESPASRPVRPLERYGIPFVSLALLVGEGQVIQPQFSVEERILSTMLNRVDWGGADFLLIDMPPGTGKSLNGILDTGLVDAVIVVATREGLAHMDNARLLHLLDRYPRVPVLGIVENMTHLICPNCGEAIDLYPLPVAEVRQSYREVPVIASLPFDPALIRQPAGGAPVPLREPDSPVGAALLALADQVVAQVTDGEDGEA